MWPTYGYEGNVVVVVPVDKSTGFLIIDTKIKGAYMLCRSAVVGPNNPATSAIFTMSRSPPNGQRHEGRIVERPTEITFLKDDMFKC